MARPSVLASERYDRERRRRTEAIDRLLRATVEIALGRDDDGNDWWGTAFFFAPNLGFTADHNLRPSGRRTFDAYAPGKKKITLEWVEERSSTDADVAVLRLVENAGAVAIEPLPARYFSRSLPAHELERTLAGRHVILVGFAVWGPGQQQTNIAGSVEDPPFGLVSLKVDDGSGRTTSVSAHRLHILGNKYGPGVAGISGAAIFDLDLQCVIGVESSCSEDGARVHGSLFHELIADLSTRRIEHRELRQHLTDLFGELPEPRSGIAFLGHEPNVPALRVLSVSVRFGAGKAPTGRVAGTADLRNVAETAVEWAGAYLRRFGGVFEQVVRENHLGDDRPYSAATFSLPVAAVEPAPALYASLALSYLAGVLRDMLVHDLKLPCRFPASLLVCACGFNRDGSAVQGVHDFARAIEAYPFDAPARVLFARADQPLVQRLTLPPDVAVKLIPIDDPEDMAREVFDSFLQETSTLRVEAHLRNLFTTALEDLFGQERAVKDGQLGAKGSEAAVSEIYGRINVSTKEADFLLDRVRLVKERAQRGELLPSLVAIVEEIDALRGRWQAAAGLVILTEATTEEEERYLKECSRLKRRLATFVHPDRLQGQGLDEQTIPEALRITSLNEHSQDLVYLRGAEGALDPLGVPPVEPVFEDTVTRSVDRLFGLQEAYKKLRERTADKAAEAASYGDVWKTELDATLRDAERALRVETSRIDALWWELRWRLGPQAMIEPLDEV